MKHTTSIACLSEALAKAQAELRDTAKNKKGYGYNYADLSSVLSDIRNVFSKYKLSFTQEVSATDKITVNTLLMHGSGEWVEYQTVIPTIVMKSCNAAQSAGAGITYARRYAISAIAGIASEEDTDATDKPVSNPPDKLYHSPSQTAATGTQMPSTAKSKDNWIKDYLKQMAEIKKVMGSELYYEWMLSNTNGEVQHANQVKNKSEAVKLYKSMLGTANEIKKQREGKNAENK